MEDNYITEIVVDLSAWTEHYPTGCILYHYGTEIDSQYCDNVDEFIDYIESFKDSLIPNVTEVRFKFDGYDLDDSSTAFDCAKEIWEYTYNLIYGKEWEWNDEN